MIDDLSSKYHITHTPSRVLIDAHNDAVRGFVPPTPEDIERQRIAKEEWEKKSEFEKWFDVDADRVKLGDVFHVEVDGDKLIATAEERCDNYFSCAMNKSEFQRLIDALQTLCNTMNP
jgi:hypothetical protein